MFHVQRMIIDRQFHRIDKVPRVLGDATKLVFGGGSVQFGLNIISSAVGETKRPKR